MAKTQSTMQPHDGGDGDGDTGTAKEEEKTAQEPLAAPPGDSFDLSRIGKIETELLAIEAVSAIAEEIAARMDSNPAIAGRPVIVASGDAAKALRAYGGFRLRMDGLIAMFRDMPPAARTESLGPISGAATALSSLSTLLAYFKAETAYIGMEFTLDEKVVVHPALAGRLLARRIPVWMPESFAPPSGAAGTPIHSLLDELLRLRHEAAVLPADAATPPARRAAALIETADAVMRELTAAGEAGKPPPLEQLLLGEGIDALCRSKPAPLLLVAKLVAAGSIRTRKHLFTTLFTGDHVTFRGGAAIGVLAIDTSTGHIALSEVFYHMAEASGPSWWSEFFGIDEPLSNLAKTRPAPPGGAWYRRRT